METQMGIGHPSQPKSMKSIWIIGASSGIGQALAESYLDGSCFLYWSSRSAAAQRQNAKLQSATHCQYRELDLEDHRQCRQTTLEIDQHCGGLDTVVFSAGLISYERGWEIDMPVHQKIFNVNYFGIVQITNSLLPKFMERKRGHLVVVASLASFVSLPLRTCYAASKHALHAYFTGLRAELHGTGVSITIIYPGFIDTGIDTRSLNSRGERHFGADLSRPNGMSRHVCAKRIRHAIDHKQAEAYIGGKEFGIVYLQRFFPRLVRRLSHKLHPKFTSPGESIHAGRWGRTHFSLVGRGDRQLLIANGLTSPFSIWKGVLEEFNLNHWQILLFNYMGRGHSMAEKSYDSLAPYDDQLEDLMRHLGWDITTCHALGYSWGVGWLCRWLAKRSLQPKTLSLVSPTYWHQTQTCALKWLNNPMLANIVLNCIGSRGLYRDAIKSCQNRETAKTYWQQIKRQVQSKPFKHAFRISLTSDLASWPHYIERTLRCLPERHCIFVGRDDPKAHSGSAQLAAFAKSGKIVEFPAAAHLLPLENPKDLGQAILSFLNQQ